MKKKPLFYGVLALMLGTAGVFVATRYPTVEKIEPGTFPTPSNTMPVPVKTATASVRTITEWYEAVGTVRPRIESQIESQVTAQVKDVAVTPGKKVTKGQVLVYLDNRRFLSRLDQAKQGRKSAVAGKEQARQAVIGAEAAYNQAASDYKRIKTYFKSQAATSQDLEKAKSAYLQAEAGLREREHGHLARGYGALCEVCGQRHGASASGARPLIAPQACCS